jgi:hypothetical protein
VIFLVAYLAAVATASGVVVAYLPAKRALLTRLESHHPEEWRRLGRPQFFAAPPSIEAEPLSFSRRMREPLEPLAEDESLPPFSRMPEPALRGQGRLARWLLSNPTSVGDSGTEGLIRRTRRPLVLSRLAVALLVAGTLAYVVLASRFA